MSEVIALRPQIESKIDMEMKASNLVFSNDGELDINLIKLLGVSVKETDNPIGFFGTGLKYAMAATLRLGGGMTIITGGKTYHVQGQNINLRSKDFTQVMLNDDVLGFTTELGKQWDAWMVVRELYSNALDESGEISISMQNMDDVESQDRTIIILEGQVFLDVWNERHRFFINSKQERPAHKSPYIDAYELSGHNYAVFYKGIKIWDCPLATLYRYNLLGVVRLTEDRTLAYAWQFNEAIEKSIITSHDPKYIARCLTTGSLFREGKLEFTEAYSDLEMSLEFQAICAKLNERAPENRNKSAIAWWKRRSKITSPRTNAQLTKVQQSQLGKSEDFLRKLGYGKELDKFPIHVVDWLGENIFGLAEMEKVFISRDCFDKGTKFLCSTILEELVHLQYGFMDECRPMQTWLFDRIITMGEEHVTGEAL